MWVKRDSTQASDAPLLIYSDYYGLWLDSGGRFNYYNGANNYCSQTVANQIWTYVGIVVSDSSSKFYVNSVAYNGVPALIASQIYNISGTFSIYYYKGLIDEIGFWNKALTPTEVSTLYNLGVGKSYPFN
jgi:hypothetical protein